MPNTEARQDRLLTVKDTAEILNFSTRQVQRWIASGQIPCLHFGRDVRIEPSEIERIRKSGITTSAEYILGETGCAVPRISRRKKRRCSWDG